MSSRYDSRTTTFSPEGRLYQVEYATTAIGQAGTALGVLTSEGVVLATERRMQHALLDTENPLEKNISGEKVYKIDEHIGVAVAGITSDASILLNYAREVAKRHTYTYQESLPAEDLCQRLCDLKQGYTQYGGVRPFGVAFLVGAWDAVHGFQLYNTEPSGNYYAWRAYAIGQNETAAQSILKQDWKEGMTLDEGITLAINVLGKTMDTAKINPDKLEVATMSKKKGQKPRFAVMTQDEMKPFIEKVEEMRVKEEKEKEEKEKNVGK